MGIVFRKELKLRLGNASGWLIIALQLFLLGLLVAVFNLISASPDLTYALSAMQWGLAVIIPMIAMGSLAGERKNGTDAWLSSLPLTAWQITAGKYAAMLVLFFIPTACAALFPALLTSFGEVSFSEAYVALLGYFLLGAALLAVCMLISSLVAKPWLALLIGAALLLLMRLCGGLLPYFLHALDLFGVWRGFAFGHLHLPGVLIYLSVTVVFLFATVRFLNARRSL